MTLSFREEQSDTDASAARQRLPELPNYQVLDLLGRGGMGIVYKARHIALDRIVALKMIRSGEDADAAALARFRGEALAIAQLRHANIVQVYEVGEFDGQPFFSLEYVEGGSLAARIGNEPQPPRDAAELVETLARAMHVAHEHGIIHRDLKPANVLLSADGTPKISDFGLVKRLHDDSGQTTQTGVVMGTPSYMAPEQASGQAHAIGPLADVYALGAILYELLTGRPPFRTGAMADTLRQVLENDPVPPRLLNPAVDRDLETICLKCLRKERGERYGSALELAEDLRRWRQGEPIQARPVGAVKQVVKWARRRPTAAALLAVSVLALAALAGLGVAIAVQGQLQEAYHRVKEAEGKLSLANDQLKVSNDKLQKTNERLSVTNDKLTTAQTALRAANYYADVGLAHRVLQEGDTARARDLLTKHLPQGTDVTDVRGFEWDYLWRLCNSETLILQQPGRVSSMALSPDSKRLAAVSESKTVTVWDLENGHKLLVLDGLHGLAGLLDNARFSPDSKHLCCATTNGCVIWWDVRTGRQISFVRCKTNSLKTTLSPDGRYLANVATGGTAITLSDTTTGKDIPVNVETPAITGVAFSHDGTRLALAVQDQVRIYDLSSGRQTTTLVTPTEKITQLTFSPCGKFLAGAGVDTFLLWDASSRQELQRIRTAFGRSIGRVRFSPQSKYFAVAIGEQVRLGELKKGQPLHIVQKPHQQSVTDIAFSPDGERLATTSSDKALHLFETTGGRHLLTFRGHTDAIHGLAFSPDGRLLCSRSIDQSVRVWDLNARPDASDFSGHLGTAWDVAFCPDGARLATAGQDAVVKIWERATGVALHTLTGHKGPVTCVAFSADGTRVTSGGSDKTVKVWDATSGKELASLAGHTDMLSGIAFHPQSMRLASASRDSTVRLWHLANGADSIALRGHTGIVTSVAYSPDGQRLASAGYDGTVRLWEADTGKQLLTLRRDAKLAGELNDWIMCVAFSPNGDRVAGGERDGVVRIWDAATGVQILGFKASQDAINTIRFSPDGARMVLACGDKCVRVLETSAGRETLSLAHVINVKSACFSPDGKRIASADEIGVVRIWDAIPPSTTLPAAAPEQPIFRGVLTQLGKHSRRNSPSCAMYSPDGKTLAWTAGDNTIRLWDVVQRQESGAFRGHADVATHLCFARDGKVLASTSPDGTCKVWDVKTGATLHTLEQRSAPFQPRSVDLSADGATLVSQGVDVNLWDLATGELLTKVPRKGTAGCAKFSPDGALLAVGGYRDVGIWDVKAAKYRTTLDHGEKSLVRAVAFSPSGKVLASACMDGTLRIWDLATGQERHALHGLDQHEFTAVAFDPDGTRLAAAGDDGTIRLWDADASTPQEGFPLFGSLTRTSSMSFSPDGEALAIANTNAMVYLLRVGRSRNLPPRNEKQP